MTSSIFSTHPMSPLHLCHPLSPLHLQRLNSQHHEIIPTSSHNTLYHGLIPRRCWTLPILTTLLGLPFESILPTFFHPLVVGFIICQYCFLCLHCTCFACLSICTVGTLPSTLILHMAGNTVCSRGNTSTSYSCYGVANTVGFRAN